jgi:hypothetical protein
MHVELMIITTDPNDFSMNFFIIISMWMYIADKKNVTFFLIQFLCPKLNLLFKLNLPQDTAHSILSRYR